MPQVLIKEYAPLNASDSQAIREALRAAGIKGTVRVGQGSTRYTVRVRTPGPDGRVIDVVQGLGYELEFADRWRHNDFVFRRLASARLAEVRRPHAAGARR